MSGHLSVRVCVYVCVSVRVSVCATLTLFVREISFTKLALPLPASFCFLFRVVVAVAVRAKKSRSRCPPVSPSVRPPACHLPVSKTAQNPCRFLSLPSFAARAAAAPTARPCNGYLNVCADTQRTCVSR